EDLNVLQLRGQQIELRSRHAGRDGLSRLDVPLYHDAVDRRVDARVREIPLRLLEGNLGGGEVRLSDGEGVLDLIELGLGDDLLLIEAQVTVVVQLRLLQRRLDASEIRPRV